MKKFDWENIMNEIIQLDEDVVVVIGTGDIITKTHLYSNVITSYNIFEGITPKSFYRIIGKGRDEDIVDALMSHFCENVKEEGEYEFKAILRRVDEEDYTTPVIGEGYLEIEHITLNFIQTFTKRKREYILNDLLASNTKDNDFTF